MFYEHKKMKTKRPLCTIYEEYSRYTCCIFRKTSIPETLSNRSFKSFHEQINGKIYTTKAELFIM